MPLTTEDLFRPDGVAERALALSYADGRHRAALESLLALDDALAQVLRTTTTPAVGQLRLAWWREALAALDHAPPPAQPVLERLAAHLLRHDVTGAMLVPIVHGWEVLVEEEVLGAPAIARYAAGRAQLFVVAGRLWGHADDPRLDAAGRGWALADLSRHLSRPDDAAEAKRQARAAFASVADGARWPTALRSLGALALSARLDLDGRDPAGHPRRAARLLWHRLTGR